MARLIDADALLNNVLDISPYCGHCDGYGFVQLEMIIDAVKEAPTIEAEPVKHGRWETVQDPEEIVKDFSCSVCEEMLCDFDTYACYPGENCYYYCPNCGAKMDLEEI